MSIKSKFKTFFFLDDEYAEMEEDQYEEEYEPEQKQKTTQKQNVVSLQSIQKSSKVVLIEPRVYAEAQDIADELRNRKAVVVNLQRIEHDQGKKNCRLFKWNRLCYWWRYSKDWDRYFFMYS